MWNPFDFSYLSGKWSTLIKELLVDNSLSTEDVDWYIFSQFSKADGIMTLEKLQEPLEKNIYYGDKYGYTGCTSPFLAYHAAESSGKFKEGDKLTLTSVGAGINMVSVLYIY